MTLPRQPVPRPPRRPALRERATRRPGRLGAAACLLVAARLLGGCTDLPATATVAATLSTAATTPMPDTLFDSETREIELTLRRAGDSAAVVTPHITWSSSADSVVRLTPGVQCNGTRRTTPDAQRFACLEARGAGMADITVRVNQTGLAVDTLRWRVQVNQKWVRIAAATNATCALNVRHAIYCWGQETIVGRAGDGELSRPTPIFNPMRLQFDSLFMGGNTACGTARGTRLAYCWGYNFFGTAGLGPGITSSIVPTPLLGRAVYRMALGSTISCATEPGNGLANFSCWGRDVATTLGMHSASVLERYGFGPESTPCQSPVDFGARCFYTPGLVVPTDLPLYIPDLFLFPTSDGQLTLNDFGAYLSLGFVSVRALAVGGSHGCAVSFRNVLSCWGDNSSQQLGRTRLLWNALSMLSVPATASDSVSLALGGNHSCVRWGPPAADGAVVCWGENAYGQSGPFSGARCPSSFDTPGVCVTPPVTIARRFVQVVAGEDHTCGRTAAGRVACWGNSADGALGLPLADLLPFAHPAPAEVRFDPSIQVDEIASGASHMCALRRRDGAVWCWGSNALGESGVQVRPPGATLPIPTVYLPTRVREPQS